MKIRTGFVSNSSSSSFRIFGVCLEEGEMLNKIVANEELAQKAKAWVEEYDKDHFNNYSSFKEALGEVDDFIEFYYTLFKGKNIEIDWDSEGGILYIGRSYLSLKGNETGDQFKQSVIDALTPILGTNTEFRNHLESVYC